jgi:hypothetical protein
MIVASNIIKLTILSILFSFFVIYGIIYISEPICVLQVDKTTGTKQVSWKIISAYSLTFSLIISICVLILLTNRRSKNIITYPVNI